MNNYNPSFDFTPEALQLVGEARLAYVRKVYSYFGLGILSGIGGALLAMQTPLVFAVARMPIMGLIVMLGLAWFAGKSSTNPARAIPTLIAFTFVSGVVISPTLFVIAYRYVGTGPSVIYNALVLSGMIFGGLTAYVWLTKKDFSYLGASLTIGLFLIIGISIINIFIGSSVMSMTLSIVSVLLFSGFILYDTSVILRNAMAIPPTLAALNLYLDFLNLFLSLLRILGGSNRR